jgi:HlyD family secretion protein
MRTSPDRGVRPLRRRDPQSRADVAFAVAPRIVAGFVFGVALVGGVGGWAATTDLSGAILASGTVAVDQRAKSVQHRDGGVVGEILVRDGQAVTASQVLLRIDDAQTRAELAIVRGQLVELAAKKARLLAERDGQREVNFPQTLLHQGSEVQSILEGELRLFLGNLSSRDSQRQQLELQIGQIAEEIAGLTKQRDAKRDELAVLTH